MVWSRSWGGIRWLAVLALMAMPGACGGAQRPPPASTTPAEVLKTVLYEASHPCPARVATATAANEPAPRLLVEALLLDAPLDTATRERRHDLKQLLQLSDLRLLRAPHFSGEFDATTKLDLEQHFGVLEQATLSRISLTPRRGELDQPVLEFALGFSLPNTDPDKNPPFSSVSLLVQAPYRKPSLGFAKHPSDPQRELIAVVTAYPMRSDEDFRTLFECKMQLRQHELEQRQ